MAVEQWRQQSNTRRPHAALGYRPPAPGLKCNSTFHGWFLHRYELRGTRSLNPA